MDKHHIRLNTIAYSFFLGVIFLFTPLLFFSNCAKYYQSRFEDYGVYKDFEVYSIHEANVNEHIENLIQHLSPLSANLEADFYSREDLLHLYDVKNILTLIYFSYIVATVYLIWNSKYKRGAFDINLLRRYSKMYIILLLFIGLMIYLNFDYLFVLAHKVVFVNDYWLLDPKTSNLIKFFPQALFFEISMIVIISNLLMHISFIMLSKKFYGKRKTK